MRDEAHSYAGASAVLATMHGKERVIAPLLLERLNLKVRLAPGLDTDRFGTFSREIGRSGPPRDAARAKIASAFESAPEARVGIASEGSFGPHPSVPFLALGRELVLLVDRETGLELSGHDASPETNFAHRLCRTVGEAQEFAEQCRFPEHGVVVIGCVGDTPDPRRGLIKDIRDPAALADAVQTVIADCGAASIETDMRAHRNPTRMTAIRRATADLVRRFLSRCANCGWPGFDIIERIPGLPCAWCGSPTPLTRIEILGCLTCGHRVVRCAGTATTADPGQCGGCNP